jgi:kynurenine formamidase
MCSPEVMAKVREEISRRRMLGIAGVAAGGAMLQSFHITTAQDATPAASPEAIAATPAAMTVLPSGISTIVDLTYTATPDFPLFPGTPPFTIEIANTYVDHGYYSNNLTHNEHTATHMDAPAHFFDGAATAELIPVEQLVAPLVVIDISERAATDPDAVVTPDDLAGWELVNGPIPEGALVAMYSGWGANVSDPAMYINLDADNVQHYPGFGADAAELLATGYTIVGIGVDTLSLDPGNSADFGAHAAMLGAGKYGIENLANLDQVPATGAYIFVGGPKTLNASGGWVRALALW